MLLLQGMSSHALTVLLQGMHTTGDSCRSGETCNVGVSPSALTMLLPGLRAQEVIADIERQGLGFDAKTLYEIVASMQEAVKQVRTFMLFDTAKSHHIMYSIVAIRQEAVKQVRALLLFDTAKSHHIVYSIIAIRQEAVKQVRAFMLFDTAKSHHIMYSFNAVWYGPHSHTMLCTALMLFGMAHIVTPYCVQL